MPASAILTMGFENEFVPLSLPLSILRAMKDSKFTNDRSVLQLRKCRKLILRPRAFCVLLFALSALFARCESPNRVQPAEHSETAEERTLQTGADQIETLIEKCGDKRVAVVANQTSLVNGTHLVDTLKARGVNLVRIFGPEHGFRGTAADGEHVKSGTDPQTGLTVVSLYGNNKKPAAEQVADLDLILFDIQDVGARFYTYISTLHLVMEAAAAQEVAVLVLDRPNPNGHFVDGPVLNTAFASFVGMHPVPVVHGMTVAEYAQMINGQGWLKDGLKCALDVLPCLNYDHTARYALPVPPSPNLPTMNAVYLYPSLAFFEGTQVSVGRGTEKPFEQIGMPGFAAGEHTFKPRSIPGVSKYPPHEGALCSGFDLSGATHEDLGRIDLSWLLEMYAQAPEQSDFFLASGFFDKLAGSDVLRSQIIAGKTAAEIRASWQADLEAFMKIRNRYLLYPDFTTSPDR